MMHTHKTETSMMAQMVNNLPTVKETQVQALGQEDTLEKGMDTHSTIFAWRIPWTEELGSRKELVEKSWI